MTQIMSMTGSGNGSAQKKGFTATVQLRSVNSRFLDFKYDSDEPLLFLEGHLRALLKDVVERGRIECIARITQNSECDLTLDSKRLENLLHAVNEIRKLSPDTYVNALDVLEYPGVTVSGGPSERELEEAFDEAFKQALSGLVSSRANEGKRLSMAIDERLSRISSLLDCVSGMTDSLVSDLRTNLQRRVDELFKEKLDPQRLEQEVLTLSMKADIQEEYDRLRSHVASAKAIIASGGLCGKKLDFLMQEFNREANTMSSKSCSLELTRICVDLKVLIEQMREQVQNLE